MNLINIRRRYLIFFLLVFSFFIDTSVSAESSDLMPYYDGTSGTYIQVSGFDDHVGDTEYVRAGPFYIPPSIAEENQSYWYLGDYHYPTIYDGSFAPSNLYLLNYGNQPYMGLRPLAAIEIGDYGSLNFIENSEVSFDDIYDIYKGQPSFVQNTINSYSIVSNALGTNYGSYYYVRDLAYLSGGYAGYSQSLLHNYYAPFYIVVTDRPEIDKFSASTTGSLNDPINFNVGLWEYVSSYGSGYVDNVIDDVYSDPLPRDDVQYRITISGDTSDVIEGVLTSSARLNSKKPNQTESGYVDDTVSWAAPMCGSYNAEIEIKDAVDRDGTNTMSTSFVVDKDCEVIPPPTGGGMCETDTFQYKVDFSATRIEGETVTKGSHLVTPVTFTRADFSDERDAYRTQIQVNIANYGVLATTATDPDSRDYYKRKKRCEDQKLERLNRLESYYEKLSPSATLYFDDDKQAAKIISLEEGESVTVNFEWNTKGDGTITGDINKNPQYYLPNIDFRLVNESDDAISTPIYQSTYEVIEGAKPNEKISYDAVVMTVNDVDEGKSEYREYFTSQVVNEAPEVMRSGYGFTYEMMNTYSNEWDNTGRSPLDALTKYTFKAKTIDSMTKKLETKSDDGYTIVYQPQEMFLEENNGTVFDNRNPISSDRDESDTLLNGGRKWYSDFEQKDGTYKFTTTVTNWGVNHVELSPISQVEIKGVAFDDFGIHKVLPNFAFPGGVGWNFVGYEDDIESLTDWYYE